jgi:hypothetical protein
MPDLNILNLVPDLSKLTGVPQGTLLLAIIVIMKAANIGARVIPDDATGWEGTLRKVCAIVGAYVPTRITSGVTVNDVAKAAWETPPIPGKVAVDQAIEVSGAVGERDLADLKKAIGRLP